MAGALDGVRILDLSWGIAGPLGVMLLAEQGADVDQGGAARRRPVPRVLGVRGLEPLAAVGHRRPQAAGGSRGVAATRRGSRRARRDVPARRHRPARHRVRRGAPAQPAPRLLLVPGLPGGAPHGRPPGLRRARPGEQRPAVGAAGLAHGPDLPAHADAEHGRDVPHPHRHPRRARSRSRRPAAGSTSRRRCSRARCSTRPRSGSTSSTRRPRSTTSWARATRRASTSRCCSRSPTASGCTRR